MLTMHRSLVIGYGNRDRGDDGVALEVIQELRHQLGQPALDEADGGWDQLGGSIDSVFVPQLAPEWLDLATGYGRLVFVDAHVPGTAGDIECTPLTPEFGTAAFTHHVTPGMFLALLEALYHSQPKGWMVSLAGHEFGFGQALSEATAALVAPAVGRIIDLLYQRGEGSGSG